MIITSILFFASSFFFRALSSRNISSAAIAPRNLTDYG